VVTRKYLERKARLRSEDDPTTPNVNEALTDPGLVDEMVKQLKTNDQTTTILRAEVVQVSGFQVGMVASRFVNAGKQAWIRQQAIWQRNDQLYYIFDFTAPSTWRSEDKPDVDDPTERVAAEVFDAMMDGVQMLDFSAILADQKMRMLRTRALMATMPRKIDHVLAENQYFRVRNKKGEDTGWVFVSEEAGDRRREHGFYVAMLSEATPERGTTVKTASEMFTNSNFRRANEAWTTITVVEKGGGPQPQVNHVSEYGASKITQSLVRDDQGGVRDPNDPKAPPMRMGEFHSLTVRQVQRSAANPVTSINKDLPVHYMPQAVSHLLPRLVPLDEATGYVFAVWVGSQEAVMQRFIDVERMQTLKFDGREIQAIPVKDRLGLEGEPTWHYFTRDGKYLGSYHESTGVSVVASDEQTVKGLWPKANIGRPHVLDQDEKEK
jgi:hypothetical protein